MCKKKNVLFVTLSLIFCLVATAAEAITTTGNNFTMLDSNGNIVGGTNNVTFSWDGTFLTSVATSGQVSNATLSSPTPFFGVNWFAHDVAVYGPGTYTIYSNCPPGSPGCGVGAAYNFTVGTRPNSLHICFLIGGQTITSMWSIFGTRIKYLVRVPCFQARRKHWTRGLVFPPQHGMACRSTGMATILTAAL